MTTELGRSAVAPVSRCAWAGDDALYVDYHDREWGLPVADDQRLFEKLCLEGFQAGLSWRTILGKREAFREVFAGFDFVRVARFTDRDIDRLVGNAAIARPRLRRRHARASTATPSTAVVARAAPSGTPRSVSRANGV